MLSLTRDLDVAMDKIEELERAKRQLQTELDELVNNQGTADKNASILFIFSSYVIVFFALHITL